MSAGELTVEALIAAAESALERGQVREAAAHFNEAFARVPSAFALAQMAANAWRLAGDVLAERTIWRSALATARPSDARSLYELGSGLLATGAPSEARECFEAVVRLLPNDMAALGALASALRADGDPQRGWALIQKAIGRAPRTPGLLLTAAQIRHALGDITGATKWLTQADRLRPDHRLTQLQRAMTLLIDGSFDAGWDAFDARGLPAGPAGAASWHGESLTGARIAVVMEEGIGDLFQFLRYVRRLEARGADRVIVECPASTGSLLTANGFDAVAKNEAMDVEWYVPLLSLPQRLGSGSDLGGDLVPYLHSGNATPVQSPRPTRIGLVWQGNPAFLATRLRDLDSAALRQIVDIPDVEWLSLQMGELLPFEHPRLAAAPVTADWLATARLLDDLDAVVSIDSAVAHLAGAMGRPVFTLLPHAPDWRWRLRVDDTPWYPSMRLVRQPSPRDWQGAVQILADQLQKLFGSRTS